MQSIRHPSALVLITGVMFAVTLFLGVSCASSASREDRGLSAIERDLNILLPTGSQWKGTLTYLNYTDSKPVTIPSTFKLTKAADGWLFAIGYDEEPHANSASFLQLVDAGEVLKNGDTSERIVGRTTQGDRVIITTELTGEDDNKPASIRKVYSIAPAAFSIQKLVKFTDGGDWFERHIYRWTR